ncbi:Cytochrome c554 and c-prime [Sphingomonas sp. YR710]|uniref:multiheme c-type cytochrome n=1 Tax=Sphingomonas sp. YR710 TaxID=1882773 RepID=UPI00088EDD04|nr:multiheme c-type cytochrome [Sphingomonas sp. YR710]SDC95809.1 Cytochrome c554 and c-prime [Sphingomonas sp. YR710]
MGGSVSGRRSCVHGLLCVLLIAGAALILAIGNWGSAALAESASASSHDMHVGVASCAGSTCHGRSEPTGKVVRQDELLRWQDPASPTGAHSRAYTVLSGARARDIAARLNIGPATDAPMCLGCHSDPAYAGKGPQFHTSDGVGCEACHGGAQSWLSSHYAVGGTHAANVARGMYPLDRPRARAEKCLDCHFGSDRSGQFVSHRIMAAGHPRVSFELDLFSALQQHHLEDADYVSRKGRTNNVKLWAIGQAVAVNRATTLFADPKLGQEGVFPEITFFDCQTCHRQFVDGPKGKANWVANPGRPIPSGMPAFNDENMIMLSAAARVAAPVLSAKFEADSRDFHAALAKDRASAVKAGKKLASSADQLAYAFARADLGRNATFDMIESIAGPTLAPRFTDYEGSVQAVMAVDTLLNALVRGGYVSDKSAAAIRGSIDRAYKAVGDSNNYRPADFRAALSQAASSIRALK